MGKFDKAGPLDVMQGYFQHKDGFPIYILMHYNGHPSVPDAAPGKWYKYQEVESENKHFGMCQTTDLVERLVTKDSWGPEWSKNYKKNTGTYSENGNWKLEEAERKAKEAAEEE